jgi:hypothetical protein
MRMPSRLVVVEFSRAKIHLGLRSRVLGWVFRDWQKTKISDE